ncbi:LolA family protein [Rhodovulum adriaticum]|uniref:Outer membrane lipoprotein-sorting protein n=1 Tax=Rhodovulum adriaticum TaxID=35804 RepID=A0A4R2NY91_RHOAD|nr:outer membrane lipoprotein carrier protein LolA [Rhodovulum adriaticum]MBK1634267.1 cell envelope biogenesis protein LolA [Rhodovulum adriaticum]TCP27180.1 outer membrane lipoprotein-sorting protein [Rhodovulum adriaticum]
MNRFALALALGAALCAAAPLPALAEIIPLSRLSAYINSFATVRAQFTQINADGTISTGTLAMKRPGRARFAYDPPNKALVLASGGQVAIFDDKSNQPPEQYPLARTPLSVILAERVDFARANMVVGHDGDDTATRVVAQDPENPEYGTIALVFTDDPVELRQWIITDGAGQSTTVILGETETGVDLPARLFSILQETARRTGED